MSLWHHDYEYLTLVSYVWCLCDFKIWHHYEFIYMSSLRHHIFDTIYVTCLWCHYDIMFVRLYHNEFSVMSLWLWNMTSLWVHLFVLMMVSYNRHHCYDLFVMSVWYRVCEDLTLVSSMWRHCDFKIWLHCEFSYLNSWRPHLFDIIIVTCLWCQYDIMIMRTSQLWVLCDVTVTLK